MVGDNLDTDIKFGKNSGIGTVLVLTGLAKTETHQAQIEEV